MKVFTKLAVMVFATISISACQKNKNESGNPNAPTAEQDYNCLYSAYQNPFCNGQYSNNQINNYGSFYGNHHGGNHQYPGFQPYPYNLAQWQNTYYQGYNGYYAMWANYNYHNPLNTAFSVCFCPAGYRPVYSAAHGLGCVSNSVVTSAYHQFLNVTAPTPGSYSSPNWSNPNIPQLPEYDGSGAPSSSSCYNQLPVSCDLRRPNSCGVGYECRAINNGYNAIQGLCAQATGYNNQYPYSTLPR